MWTKTPLYMYIGTKKTPKHDYEYVGRVYLHISAVGHDRDCHTSPFKISWYKQLLATHLQGGQKASNFKTSYALYMKI